MKISKPTLLIDETKCRDNIERMSNRAKSFNLDFRPHFKTHQSLEIGTWFKEVGVSKITVSSLSMAEYFSDQWDDITVAFPVNISEIDTINELASKITLILCVENIESVIYLANHLDQHVSIYIKVDVGYHRTGINPNDKVLIDAILHIIKTNPKTSFKGFLGHSGHTYNSNTAQEIKNVHTDSLKIMIPLKENYINQYPELIVSLGDTPSCSIAEEFFGVDEIRPGNFIFYDLTQNKIGSNTIDQIAVAMVCPIVAIHTDRSEIVVYGGGVHFSKDRLETQDGTIYGRVVENIENGWGNIIDKMYVKNLSQEHGIITVPKSRLTNYTIGDYLTILPVHSCMTANAMKSYLNKNTIIKRL